jgi:hypothetical protein
MKFQYFRIFLFLQVVNLQTLFFLQKYKPTELRSLYLNHFNQSNVKDTATHRRRHRHTDTHTDADIHMCNECS